MKTELFGFKAPSASCTDKKCPFHGEIQVKKELLKGVVVRKDINHSATISWSEAKKMSKELLAETAAREHGKKKEEKDMENKDTTKDMKHKKSQEALHDESSKGA